MSVNFGDERLPERFWDKVSPEPMSGCWLWCAAIKGFGYGNFGHEGRFHSAHKLAYVKLIGPVPDGLVLDHLCRTRLCCNPGHLEPVSTRTNLVRSPAIMRKIGWRRGYWTRGRRERCPSGHRFEGANVAWSKDGQGRLYQRCRACCSEQAKRYQR